MTGLSQDGQAIASSRYSLYGSTTGTTDTTGNPFAYNGEARDVTGLTNPLLRYGADTASETVVDTLVDSATGGNVTPASIGTNLVLNAVSEGISARTVKADVPINKPKAGDVRKKSNQVIADDIIFSNKFSKKDYLGQVVERGWNNQMIADTINNPVKTTKGYNKYTNSSVTNYYIDDIHYVAIDDSTGKVIQIADLKDSDWRGPK